MGDQHQRQSRHLKYCIRTTMRPALRLLSLVVPPYSAGQRAGKLTTGIHGLPVHPNPLPTLLDLYKSTLSTLQTRIPQGVVYRQSAEAITQHRVGIIEKHVDLGRIEEVIKMAEGEKSLVEKMSQWKSWEDLQHKPEKGQWEYFAVSASTSLPSTE